MAGRDFYHQIDLLEEAIVGTIIHIENNREDKQLTGEKFFITPDNNLNFSKEIPGLARYFKQDDHQGLDYRGLLNTELPALKIFKLRDGSELQVFLERLTDKPRLLIFGGGHIALPLARIMKLIDFEVIVIDDREDLLTRERFPGVDDLIVSDIHGSLEEIKIKADDYIVICTRAHHLDYLALRSVIRSKASYIGMIGGTTKINSIFNKLQEEEGIEQSLLDKVYTPIGLEIGSETPEEIGVAIAAEIISIRRGKNE